MPFINTTTEVKVQGVLYTGKVHFVAVPFVSLENTEVVIASH